MERSIVVRGTRYEVAVRVCVHLEKVCAELAYTLNHLLDLAVVTSCTHD